MKTRVEMLQEMGVAPNDAEQYIGDLERVLPKYGIANSSLRLAHFISQVLHESGMMRFDTEGLNYSAKTLLRVFGRYFKTRKQANAYAFHPDKIANRIYANRMGNGSEASGDGFRYRGRGLIQLTGKNNYRAFAKWADDPRILDEPERVASLYAVHSAVFYWDKNSLNKVADQDDVRKLTKRINGGYHGLAHRTELLNKANGLLAMLEFRPGGPSRGRR